MSDGANSTHFPTEFLDLVEISGLPQHNLEMKKGSPIILMRNLNPSSFCNRKRTIMEEMYKHLTVARIITAAFRNKIVITCIKLNLFEGEDTPLQQSQFPV